MRRGEIWLRGKAAQDVLLYPRLRKEADEHIYHGLYRTKRLILAYYDSLLIQRGLTKMYLIPFVELFPRQAMATTRTITIRGHPKLPDDEYALVKAYCPDPACDCRRVMLNVLGRWRRQQGYLASISFGFDRDPELAGPFLDPLNPQSQYAGVLFDLVAQILESDPGYVARLEAHYHQVKQAVADPMHPAHQVLARLEAGGEERPARRRKGKRKRERKRWRR